MLTSQQKKRLYALLEGLGEARLSDDRFSRLDRWLRSDREVREIYVHYLQMWADLSCLRQSLLSLVHQNTDSRETLLRQENGGTVDWSDPAVWQALLEAESTAPLIARAAAPAALKPVSQDRHKVASCQPSRFWPFVAVASTAVLVLLLVLPLIFTPSQEVATVMDCVEARWDRTEPAIYRGQRLPTKRILRVQDGLVKLQFDAGAQVIVEAPAVFKLLSANRMFLDGGRLRALVPANAQGFTVETPSAKIVDLGTEFGMTVPQDGRTLAGVFQGLVEVSPRHAPRQETAVPADKQISISEDGHLGPVENLNKDHGFLHSWEEELGLVGEVQAAGATWTHVGTDTLWSTPANWDTNVLPHPADDLSIRTAPGPTITNDGALAKTVSATSTALTVDGGTLTVGAWITLRGTDSILIMNRGTVTVGTCLNVSEGIASSATLTMNGGTITTRGSLRIGKNEGAGRLNLYGGTVNTKRLEFRWQGGIGTMDIRAGTLIIDGDAASAVQGYIDKGWVTAYDGAGGLHLDYDVTNKGKTTLSATSRPDPNPNP